MPYRSCPLRPSKLIALLAVLTGLPAMAQDGRTYECLIEPKAIVNVGSRSTGILQEVQADRGMTVTKGQVLAVLNSDIEAASVRISEERAKNDADIALAEARLDFEKLNTQRVETLHDRNVASLQDLETARASLQIARLQVEAAQREKTQAQLDYERSKAVFDQRTIRSPLDGVVVETPLSPGEFVSESSVVVTIAEIDPLHVSAFLPLEMMGTIEIGDQVTVLPQEPTGGQVDGVVDVIDRVIDARSGTIGVRITVPNPDLETLAGLRCQVRF
ncbi:efflux RND transporter periplasmic adaptor subunit [Pseudooceanicola sp. MF1-13]|uniref:efflux RND transporter periplasmic adaptor subunit n=1 Tax=Pseudooceanicola sp. MF1-13 TaxID=3379095 RepID=UPI0038922978